MFNFQVIKVTAQPICSGYEVKIFILSIDLEGNLHEQLMNSWNFLRYISHFLKHVTVVNISLILTNSEKMGDLNILNFWRAHTLTSPFRYTSANTGSQNNHFNQGSIDNWSRILDLKKLKSLISSLHNWRTKFWKFR